jgi:hypothetical protein
MIGPGFVKINILTFPVIGCAYCIVLFFGVTGIYGWRSHLRLFSAGGRFLPSLWLIFMVLRNFIVNYFIRTAPEKNVNLRVD